MESLLLDKIDQPSDLKKLNAQQVEKLCAEIRHFMLENISKTGGHLASNLGTVELTVARCTVCWKRPRTKSFLMWGISATPTNCLPDAGNSLTICASWMAFPAFRILTKSVHDAFIAGHGNTALSLPYRHGLGQKDPA